VAEFFVSFLFLFEILTPIDYNTATDILTLISTPTNNVSLLVSYIYDVIVCDEGMS